jgi:hypothetical protein
MDDLNGLLLMLGRCEDSYHRKAGMQDRLDREFHDAEGRPDRIHRGSPIQPLL